jgi:hypothetical protein
MSHALPGMKRDSDIPNVPLRLSGAEWLLSDVPAASVHGEPDTDIRSRLAWRKLSWCPARTVPAGTYRTNAYAAVPAAGHLSARPLVIGR